MRGFLFCAALSVLIPFSAAAAGNDAPSRKADSDDVELKDKLDSTVVSASRAGKNTPVTYTMVGKDELRSTSPLNSLPMTLNLQPSVVAVNEGGTGLGYSKMTVRGSKGSQVNVTFNGITLNDAESQEVFWVNIPALSNILSSVQLQRGLGTSANGAGAFGASINMSTASVGPDPYGNVDVAYGSYDTFTTTVGAGTGLTRSGVYFDFAYSYGHTDGYIRNAKANVKSVYSALGWMNETNSVKLTYLMGDQSTGITWNGIDPEIYQTNRKYNDAGEYYDVYGNVHYYDNETDNYTQHHLQANYTHQFRKNVVWSTTLNYTKGFGYYEQYKTNKKMSYCNMESVGDIYTIDPATGNVSTTNKSDFIIRKTMDNYYLVLNSEVRYTADKLNLTGGANISRYDGDHYGDVLWNSYLGDSYDYDSFNDEHSWYFNNGTKREVNIIARAEYTPLDWLTAYVDLQYRCVDLKMSGYDDDDLYYPVDYHHTWNFFNPRGGLTFNWNRNKAYISVAYGNREPGRSDIKEVIEYNNNLVSTEQQRSVKPEKMVDFEIGYVYTAPKVTVSGNIYLMEYFDMLLETGRLSSSGYAIKENVDRGYRRGIEAAVAWQPTVWLRVDANATLSLNEIKDYIYYMPVYDDDYNLIKQEEIDYGKTNMLMSPGAISLVQLSITPFKNTAHNSLKTTTLAINGKYVSKQYIDNTESNERCVPRYFVSNLSLTHEFNLSKGELGVGAYVNNLFNNKYFADGWSAMEKYEGSDDIVTYLGIYPQATTNFMFKLSYRF